MIAALLVGAVVPFTFLGIMPTNNKLLTPGRDLSSTETRDLLIRWGKFVYMSSLRIVVLGFESIDVTLVIPCLRCPFP